MTPEETGPLYKPEADPIIEALNKIAAESEDKIWRTNAMAQLTVRFADGKFKKTSLAAGDPELLFKGVRAGQRAKFIFEFEPVDSRPFVAVELDETKVFGLIPGFEEHMVKVLGYGEPTSIHTFGLAIARVRKETIARAKEAAEAAEAVAAQSEASRYAKNPLWGAF